MRFLLDVNALIALAHTDHEAHSTTTKWFARTAQHAEVFFTCAITELGFARVSVQARLEPDVDAAKRTLGELRKSSSVPFKIVGDDIGIEMLPTAIRGHSSITDAHLILLAKKYGAKLATLDTGIEGAELIS
ncbi:MAG: PIN domain-containing protein [Opitutaceae bacterium]|nr:PIN domain-containing protein [Opitutaceae bacterium]